MMNNFLSFWSGKCFCLLKSLIGIQPRSSTGLIDLPPDVIVDILMRLPIKSIYSLRCASKTISDVIDSPLFAQMHMSRSLNSGMNPLSAVSEVPQLMLHYNRQPVVKKGSFELHLEALKYDGEHDLRKTDYNLHPDILSRGDAYDVEFVFYNLFFFTLRYSRRGSGLLLNPLKGEVMEIPLDEIRATKYKFQKDYYGMGLDITANTYKLVCVSVNNHDLLYQVSASVYVLGQSSWRKIRAVPPAKLSKKYVCAHGDVHWFVEVGGSRVRRPSYIISFDFNKEEFCWTPHPTFYIHQHCHLLNFKGSLAIVETSTSSPPTFVKIWVMKNYSKKEWSLYYEIDFRRSGCDAWRKFDIPSSGWNGLEENLDDRLRRHLQMLKYNTWERYTCGEWENGIFFALDDGGQVYARSSVCYFLDLKCNSMRRVENAWSGFEKRIFGYTGSLISLKDYNSLVKET